MKLILKENSFNRLVETLQNSYLGNIIDIVNEWLDNKNFNLQQKLGEPIGKGSSRVVYQIDDDLCIKVAFNEKGITQNKQEYETYMKFRNYDIFTKIYYKDDDFRWLVSERALELQDPDLIKVFGFGENTYAEYEDDNENSHFIDYSEYIEPNKIDGKHIFETFTQWCYDYKNGIIDNKIKEEERKINAMKSEVQKMKDEGDEWAFIVEMGHKKMIDESEKTIEKLNNEIIFYLDKIKNNEFLKEYYDFIMNTDILIGDIYYSNLGLVQRNGEPCVVLLDYGITQELYNKHYKK